MAKRTPRSQPDAAQPPAPPADDAKSARPRARGGSRRATTPSPDLQATADDPTVASAPTIATTEAARPGPADEHPPEDTIAADPRVTEANQVGEIREPSDEEIRRRAYDLYLERGGTHGLHEDDWHRAERELRGKQK